MAKQMTPQEAYEALGIPYDEEAYASSPTGDLYQPIPASFPLASFNPVQEQVPASFPPPQNIGQNEFFNPNLNASRFDPTRAPAGSPLASQSGQVAANAQNQAQGGLGPHSAPLPLPPLSAPQGGPPAAPVSPFQTIPAHGPAPTGGGASFPGQAAIANIGVSQVPPPPTNVPIQEPLAYPPPTPPEQAPPNQFVPGSENLLTPATRPLADAYRPAFEQAMEARQRDLAAIQKGSGLATMAYYADTAAGITPPSEVAARMMAPYAGVELDTLKKAADTAENVAKAQVSNAAWDPKSPLAEASRISFLVSPEAEMMAVRYAQESKVTPAEAKQRMYELTKGMTPVAIEMMQKNIKASGDYSFQRANEMKARAEEQAQLAQAAKLLAEAENIPKELGNPYSIISATAREFFRGMFPREVARIQDFESLSARELMGMFEGKFANTIMEVTKWRIDATRESFRQMDTGTERYTVKTVPSAGTGIDSQIANVMPVSMEQKREFINTATQTKQALEYAGIIATILKAHNGVVTKAMLEARTGDGPLLKNALLMLARNAANIAPQNRGTLQSIIDNMNSSGDLRDLWDGGQLTTVMTVVNDIANNFRAAHAPFRDNYIDSNSPMIPAWPPVHLLHIPTVEDGQLVIRFPNGLNGIKEEIVYRNYNGNWIPDRMKDGTPIQVRY